MSQSPNTHRLAKAHTHKRAGQTLVGLLVVLVIIAILAAIIFPNIAARHHKAGQPLTPRERGYQAACGIYEAQINQAVMMYKQDNDGRNPPSLEALKPYGVTNDMVNSPDCVFQYDPATGVARNAAEGALGDHGVVNPTSPDQLAQPNGSPAGAARPSGPPVIGAPPPQPRTEQNRQRAPGGSNEIQLPGGLHMPNPNGNMSGYDDNSQ